MTTVKEQAAQPIKRYSIGYATDDWGTRSSIPGGIPDAFGSWVRYEDHVAQIEAAAASAATGAAAERAVAVDRGDLYLALHGLSKILESSGVIDVNDTPNAYSTILNAMNFVAAAPAQPAAQRAPAQDGERAVPADPLVRRFGGCPSCGQSACVAMSCTRPEFADLLLATPPARDGERDTDWYEGITEKHFERAIARAIQADRAARAQVAAAAKHPGACEIAQMMTNLRAAHFTKPAPSQGGRDYPPLPPAGFRASSKSGAVAFILDVAYQDGEPIEIYNADHMRAYVDADRASTSLDATRYQTLKGLGWIDSAIMESFNIDEHDPTTLDAALDKQMAIKRTP